MVLDNMPVVKAIKECNSDINLKLNEHKELIISNSHQIELLKKDVLNIDKRIDETNKRIDETNKRIDDLKENVNNRFDEINKKLDSLVDALLKDR
jgi:peptidoglycan hydrolase CwlO-like protein